MSVSILIESARNNPHREVDYLVKWFIALMMFALGGAALAGDNYYLLVFSNQLEPFNRPRFSHSFAVFVRVSGEAQRADIESITISWLPATLQCRPFKFREEPGVLLDVPSTMHWAEFNGATTSLWGPFQIHPELYARAQVRAAELRSGRISYQFIDHLRGPQTVDCIHAVSGVDMDCGRLHTRTAHGDAASYILVQHLCRWIIHPEVTHDWVLERLCLSSYCLVRRSACCPPRAFLPVLPAYYD